MGIAEADSPGGLFLRPLTVCGASGSTVASYTYDPYGKVLTATGAMAEINPLRYRGYYYDSETGLYYLQSVNVNEYLSRVLANI